MIAYLNQAIQTRVPPEGTDVDPDPLDDFHPCLTRGPVRKQHESVSSFNKRCQKDLNRLAEACQRHTHKATCYKNWKGPPQEKKCRFELDEANKINSTVVDDKTGELTLQKLDGMVNNFNSTMLRALRCNMDIKFIGTGCLAKAALYYITNYISKAQLKSHVSFATLEVALRKLGKHVTGGGDITMCAKKLLTKCANMLIGLQELSAPQVASYVLDFEDHFTGHKFRHLYWPSFEAHTN